MKLHRIIPVMAIAALCFSAVPRVEAQYGGGVVIPNAGPVSGIFRPGLPIDPGTNRAFVDYVMNVAVPGQYTIDLVSSNSSAYDPYLYLLHQGRQIASNDDGGGYPNAQIRRQLAPGTYIVRVSSFRSGMPQSAGHYTLSAHGGGAQMVHHGGPAVQVGYPMGQVGGQMVVPAVPVQGVFRRVFPVQHDGRPYTDYVLNIVMPGNYQIDLMSPNASAYDPYLYLMQNGRQLATNDDGGGYPNSRITRFLNPGVYVVRVSSFRRGVVGPASFTLMVMHR